jgi:CheY-like chemotaxis protein
LSLCRSIIEEHGGTITVESEPGRGTTFLISLPVRPRPAETVAPSEISAPEAGGRQEHILVVDDEPGIAALLVEVLEHYGYRVQTAGDGAEALRLLEGHSYDLILSDTQMPGLNGIEFYRELERRHPALAGRMVFITGDLLNAEKRRFLESTGAPCLAKPFDLADVQRVVRRRLAEALTG